MTTHPTIEFIAGDDWEIRATLVDESGNPYDLTTGSPQIRWLLYDSVLGRIIDNPTIVITDGVNGKVSIKVAAAVTTTIAGGRTYRDALRLTIAGQTATLLMGLVSVIGDPWAVAATRSLRLVKAA